MPLLSACLRACAFVLCGTAAALASHAATDASAPEFAQCFTLQAGTRLSFSDRSVVTITASTFQGQPATAVVNDDHGVRLANYFDRQGRRWLGTERFGIAAWGGDTRQVVLREVFDAIQPQFPARAEPGTAFLLEGQGQRTKGGESEPVDWSGPRARPFVFVGFEPVQIKTRKETRTLENACHLSSKSEGSTADYWYAPGYGVVRMKITQDDGQPVMSYTLQRIEELEQ